MMHIRTTTGYQSKHRRMMESYVDVFGFTPGFTPGLTPGVTPRVPRGVRILLGILRRSTRAANTHDLGEGVQSQSTQGSGGGEPITIHPGHPAHGTDS